jgi:hypothetical protein
MDNFSTDLRDLSEKVRLLEIKMAVIETKQSEGDKALDLAREITDAWKLTANEWRDENVDQRNLYLTIEKGQALVAVESAQRGTLESRVSNLQEVIKINQGEKMGSSDVWKNIVTIFSMAVAFFSIAWNIYVVSGAR